MQLHMPQYRHGGSGSGTAVDHRPGEDLYQMARITRTLSQVPLLTAANSGSIPRSTSEKSMSMILLQTFPMEWVQLL